MESCFSLPSVLGFICVTFSHPCVYLLKCGIALMLLFQTLKRRIILHSKKNYSDLVAISSHLLLLDVSEKVREKKLNLGVWEFVLLGRWTACTVQCHHNVFLLLTNAEHMCFLQHYVSCIQ